MSLRPQRRGAAVCRRNGMPTPDALRRAAQFGEYNEERADLSQLAGAEGATSPSDKYG